MADELCQLPATEQARLIRTGTLSARELLSAHLERIAEWNPRLNAIVTLAEERARADAAAADEAQAHGADLGPLHGLPAAHKDLTLTAGIRTTFGSPLFADYVPDEDAPIVTRMRAAGAITIGKTNTPEFGAGSQTFNQVFGATRNPWDPTRTCGGSSGGAAVALACGMVPLADGTDMGGSLRNPAAFCGVVGLRPTPGLVPDSTPESLSTPGPMARTVRDVALFLSVLAGRPELALAPEEGIRRGLRIAWFQLPGLPFEPEVRRVVDAARGRFERDLGCIVESADPDLDGAEEAFLTLRAHHFEITYGSAVRANPSAWKETIRWEVARAADLSPADIERAHGLRARFQQSITGFLDRYDAYVLPVTQVLPFSIDAEYPTQVAGSPMPNYLEWMKSCWLLSLSGRPIISVPCGFSSTEPPLPVGLQIIGRDEASLLALAQAWEHTACSAGLLRTLREKGDGVPPAPVRAIVGRAGGQS